MGASSGRTPLAATLARIGLATAACTLCFLGLAVAEVPAPPERLAASEADGQPSLLPELGAGEWRTRVQLVWDRKARQLERRRYRIWDPLAAQSFDLFWQPADPPTDTAGPINGKGVLTWSRPDATTHNAGAVVAQYRGEMVDGRFRGEGSFRDRSGARYDGAWRDSLMDGQGALRLPNGDAYVGGFKAGRIDGAGRYVDATGTIYEGGFVDGKREGVAVVREPNGASYSSVWSGGREDVARRVAVAAPEGLLKLAEAGADEPADISISVSVDRQTNFCCDFGPGPLNYTSKSSDGALEVFPDAPDLLDTWRGKENIMTGDPVGFDWDRAMAEEYSFLNYASVNLHAVPLILGLENKGTLPVRIASATIHVDDSELDAAPALQATYLYPLQSQNIAFSIENYGWAPAKDATLVFHIRNAKKNIASEEMTLPIGTIDSVQQFSFEALLASLGVDVSRLESLATDCKNVDRPADCVADFVKQGVFGKAADYLVLEERSYGLDIDGEIRFTWDDSRGQSHDGTVPFAALMPIGSFVDFVECEGAELERTGLKRPFMLQIGAQDYRIPVPLRDAIPAGVTGRWRLMVDAEKTSLHKFRITLAFADGRTATSRLIDLELFKPRFFPESLRPFEPRC